MSSYAGLICIFSTLEKLGNIQITEETLPDFRENLIFLIIFKLYV